MVKNNYKPWLINIDDFPKTSSLFEQFKFLLQFALLAPSTHNSQPWEFRIDGNKIFIQPNFDRKLPVGDAGNNFLYLSLGCALENLLVAAQHYGFCPKISYPDQQNDLIEVDLKKEDGSNFGYSLESLVAYISKRTTNRFKFTDRLVDNSFLNTVRSLKNEDLNIDIIAQGEKNDQIKTLLNETTASALSNPLFRKELSLYVKNNLTKSKFGMPAFVRGVPLIPSLLVPTILKYINIEGLKKNKQDKNLDKTTFVIISTKKNNKEDWIKTGQVFQRINLLATKSGIFTQPVVAPLHSKEGYLELQKILNTNFRPQFLFRLGYGTAIPKHSPRMSIDNCLIIDK